MEEELPKLGKRQKDWRLDADYYDEDDYERNYFYRVGVHNKQGRKQRYRELKYFDQSLLDTFNTAGDGVYLRREYNPMGITQGDDNNNRLGTEAILTSLDLRAYFSIFFNPGIKINRAGAGQSDNLSARIRLLVFVDRDGSVGDGTALGQEGGYNTFNRSKSILSDGSFWSFYNLDNAPRYEILHDECFEIKPDIKAKKWNVRGLLDTEIDTREYTTGTYPELPTRTEFFQYAGNNQKIWSINVGGTKYLNMVPTATADSTVNLINKGDVLNFAAASIIQTQPIAFAAGVGTVGPGAVGAGNQRGAFSCQTGNKPGLMTATTTVPAFHSHNGAPNEGPITVENDARFESKTVETNENAETRQWTPDLCFVKKQIHINLNNLESKFKDGITTFVTTRQVRWGLIVDSQTFDVNVEYNTRTHTHTPNTKERNARNTPHRTHTHTHTHATHLLA